MEHIICYLEERKKESLGTVYIPFVLVIKCQQKPAWGKSGIDLNWPFLWVSQQRTVSKLWVAQQDLMIAEERWQLVRRCLQLRQLWTPWDSQDESILHFYSQEKGEDNCSVLVAASNCFERWRTVIKSGVTNHLDSDKSLESHSEHAFFFLFMIYQLLTTLWSLRGYVFSCRICMST